MEACAGIMMSASQETVLLKTEFVKRSLPMEAVVSAGVNVCQSSVMTYQTCVFKNELRERAAGSLLSVKQSSAMAIYA